MGKLIVLNGPAGCGKTEAATHIRGVFGAEDGRAKAKLLEIASTIFNVPLDLWEHRQGKETPNYLLRVPPWAWEKLGGVIELAASTECLTPREALIYVSEVVIKPAFGPDYFAKIRQQVVESSNALFVDDSCGFHEEVRCVNAADLMFIRVTGRGVFSLRDTRTYLDPPDGCCSVEIGNYGTLAEFLRAVRLAVQDWLTR